MLQSDGVWQGDKIYSCADTSQTGIKGWKASVLTYWASAGLPAPSSHLHYWWVEYSLFSNPRAQGHKHLNGALLTLLEILTPYPLDLKPMFALVPSPCVCVRGLFTLPFTKTWGIILSGLQPWKQFSTPFSAAFLEIASIGYFWPQSKSCRTWLWRSKIWLYSELKHAPQQANAIVEYCLH